MSIGNARKFIKRAMVDSDLRTLLNNAESIQQLDNELERNHLQFSAPDFEDAYNNLLTQCQFEEQAEQLAEFRMWWELLLQLLPDDGTEKTEGSCLAGSQNSSCGTCGGCKGK